MSTHFHSSGRGGAGNIVDASQSPKLQPEDLQTPTLKTSVVTTGRGGTGNMAFNKDPVETRRMQDVEPVPRTETSNPTHIGRGGNGNVFDPKAEEARAASRSPDGSKEAAEEVPGRKGEEPGWAEKGRNLLFGKKQ